MEQIQTLAETILVRFNIAPETIFLGNTVLAYVYALLIFIALLIAFRVFKYILLKRLEHLSRKTETDIDDTVIEVLRSLRPPFYFFLALYLSLKFLVVHEFVAKAINIVLITWVFYQIIIGVQILINILIKKRTEKDADPTTRSALDLIGRLLKGALWGVGILMILSNIGVNVSSLLAGLGIGGIAIAFALQNILSDLFSSFAIYFDKPFTVGDFIVVGEHLGTVEGVGIKTTRIRALQGEEIVISNKELTSVRVQNFGKMETRRIAFSFGVLYETPLEKVKAIPSMVEEIIEGVEFTRFDRAHFKSFGDSSLDFEVVYYVESSDYNKYMDIQQEINTKIMERFKQEGIDFAYPTRTVYMHGGSE